MPTGSYSRKAVTDVLLEGEAVAAAADVVATSLCFFQMLHLEW